MIQLSIVLHGILLGAVFILLIHEHLKNIDKRFIDCIVELESSYCKLDRLFEGRTGSCRTRYGLKRDVGYASLPNNLSEIF